MGFWDSPAGKIAIGVLVTIIAAVVFFTVRFLNQIRRLRTGKVLIQFRDNRDLPADWRLVLRHVRDGKDKTDGRGRLLNRDIQFTSSFPAHSPWSASVKYDGNIGFQFKCYVEAPRGQSDHVKLWLAESLFDGVINDETKKERVWFLLPGVARCESVEGHINNFGNPDLAPIEYRVELTVS